MRETKGLQQYQYPLATIVMFLAKSNLPFSSKNEVVIFTIKR